ncbi:MAG: 2-polyprenyl-3-methyl-6-methoxy-1,4-benzoquinone monooxygenase [Burkholderiaceae bacterium]|nr:2-polyprenyl-3-methyl-6-methoxy-1,4-benzoquinone monooxygenase [Burkholderiaceae bacterium]
MLLDRLISEFDQMLRTVTDQISAKRPVPVSQSINQTADLTQADRKEVARLMRVNHVGEICAQALYQGQALATEDQELQQFFLKSAQEESDHLAWLKSRLDELEGSTSLLNPLWYAGAFGLGFVAGKFSDKTSLALMAETEHQVEAHLQNHLSRLPAADTQSQAILEQMRKEEVQHGNAARARGGPDLPLWARLGMRVGAKIMTKTAYYL